MDRRWPRAVIFDMDGLMFGTEQMIQRSWDEVGPELGYEPLGHNIYQTMGMNRASRMQYFLEHYGADFPFDRFQDAYRERVRICTERDGVPVKPGLLELLEYLKKEKIPAVVATGSSRTHALDLLERTGVLPYFQFVLAGDQVKVAKPDPEIYVKTCEMLGRRPEEVLVLEDSWNGVRSAHAAGTPVILIPDLQKDSSPVEGQYLKKMESLKETAEWLKNSCRSKENMYNKNRNCY
ncbi:MAG TPA: HAD family phosphatase [Candidatus Scatomonas pullistercoris]|uniref:HAD family phosphatase n=1 Tax=Candidatus Scatomonas pullistercoris TaxID=2840920 RepID=A0A9D1P2R4_9FIRM|nr:HAD family phosphatase [Candidatus Scatomonas pullistercoris]